MVEKLTVSGFLNEFIERHRRLSHRPFCWVIGAGASVQSGIPAGGTLAMQWLKELHQREDFEHRSLEEWCTAKNSRIPGLTVKNAALFYPFIYRRRFEKDKEMGYAFIEEIMEKAEPSYGYSVLAQIMTQTDHNVAVTTNFDNLLVDAISQYKRPLVCGHELLTGFIRPNSSRPTIAKVHRDLLLNPKSRPEEIEKLSPEWEDSLNSIFRDMTPIVIGYGGNDGSVMGFLKNVAPLKNGMFWCYMCGHEPSESVQEVVARHGGNIVPIAGFDELMLQFAAKLELASPIPELKKIHECRVQKLTGQLRELEARLKKAEQSERIEKEFGDKMRPWEKISDGLADMAGILLLNQELQQITSVQKREEAYREREKSWGKRAWFCAVFADFLWKERKNFKEANKYFRSAIELDPGNASEKGYAEFLEAHPEFK